jgi:hypothetical protein
MSETLEKAGICPSCGTALRKRPAPDPAAAWDLELARYDLLALVAEAAEDKAYDESAKVRVTQQDIRKLLDKRRKSRK